MKRIALAIALAIVILASVCLAALESTEDIVGGASLATTAGAICLGPFAGWMFAIRDGDVLVALWSLLPATLFSVGPLVLWVYVPRVALLLAAALAWVLSGYFYAVVIWV